MVAGEGQSSQETEEWKSIGPMLGTSWEIGRRGKCLQCAAERPRFVIPVNKLERYRSYMRDHALICKFIGAWSLEIDLSKQIQQKWQP